MPKITGKYETVFIVDVNLGEENIAAMVEKFKTLIESNGTVTNVNEWGKRRLAYPINYKTEGYYVLVNYTAEASVPKEIERNLQISDSILRYLTVKVEEKRSNVKPRPVRVAPVAEEAAPAVEAAPAAEAEAPAQAE